MPSNAPQIEMAKGDFLDASLYTAKELTGLPALGRGALIMRLSRAFDLAENRPPGHALRVAYMATSIAREMALSPRRLEEVCLAGLLHDAGMASAGRLDAAGPPIGAHCAAGAQMARSLGLPENVARAIESHHPGNGPRVAARRWKAPGAAIARIVAVADRLDAMLEGATSPLSIRRQGSAVIASLPEEGFDARVAEAAVRVVGRDAFWLALHDNDLTVHLAGLESGPKLDSDELMDCLAVVSDAIDVRSGRMRGRGRQIAQCAEAIARCKGFTEGHVDLVKAAALLQDIGTLGVPVRYMSKPDILTVEEMAAVQMHPVYARDIVSDIPGFGAIAWWVGCHHERVDGKGYPGMLEGNDVPVEAQIIGMAEALVALRSARPYRPAMSQEDALDVIQGMCGTRFDESLMPCLKGALGEVALG